MSVVFKTTDPVVIKSGWANSTLRLLYADSTEVVPSETSGMATFREISYAVEGDTLTLLLKVQEISRNHQRRLFCFAFNIGATCLRTTGFEVRTKRTKRKRPVDRRSRPSDSSTAEYGMQARELIQRLQWFIGGYSALCDGVVDYTRPILVCPICRGRKQDGHLLDCPVLALL